MAATSATSAPSTSTSYAMSLSTPSTPSCSHPCIVSARSPALAGSPRSAAVASSSFLGKRLTVSHSSRTGSSHSGARLSPIVAGKGRQSNRKLPGRFDPASQQPKVNIDVDDPNPQFALFIRNKKLPLWYPLSIVSAGTAAKMLVDAQKIEWMKNLYGDTLTKNVAQSLYKDEDKIRGAALKNYPILKTAKELQFGYKVVDKANPQTALSQEGIILIPPKEEVKGLLDKAADFFKGFGKTEEEAKPTSSP